MICAIGPLEEVEKLRYMRKFWDYPMGKQAYVLDKDRTIRLLLHHVVNECNVSFFFSVLFSS